MGENANNVLSLYLLIVEIFSGRSKMSLKYYSIILTVIHAIVVVLHGLAHANIPVPLSLVQSLFVDVVIVLAPIVAAVLLWTSFDRMGNWLFLSSMTGALLFGIYNHFIAMSPDHISQIPFDDWGVLFQVTALLLLVTEGIGCGVGVWALNPTRQKAL
jgi:predicted neutral ceramidase superfamily lipid hydrolase